MCAISPREKPAPRNAHNMLDRANVARALAAPGPIVVALSGGGDSTALLHFLTETAGAARLRVAVVDHGLRTGSADDAQRALGLAEHLGVAGQVLTLSGVKAAQASARTARYQALCAYARAQASSVIALGHTRDDQAETVFMRAASGSGWRGLAGMSAFAPAPLWPEGRELMLMRPLLGVRRAALREALAARGAAWLEDPANANPVFERVRVRQRLAALEAEGLDTMRFAAIGERIAPHLAALDAAAADLIARAVRFAAGSIEIESSAWVGTDAVRQRALGVLIMAAGAGEREPRASQLAALCGQMAAPSFKSATLGGTLISRAAGQTRIARDKGALSGRADGAGPLEPLALPEGVEAVWDGRAALTMKRPGWSVLVEAGAPVLARGEDRLPIEAASPVWLLAERVARELGATPKTWVA